MSPVEDRAAAAARWKREQSELEDRVSAAREFKGFTASTAPDPVTIDLRRDERVFLVLDGVELVEPPRSRIVQTWQVEDTGTATITDRRVVFSGTKRRREWAYSKLVEEQHQELPRGTTFRVSNRQRVSGIAYGTNQAADARFALDLALARHHGTLPDLSARLERELVEHERERPPSRARLDLPIPPPVASIVVTLLVLGAALLTTGGPTPTFKARGQEAEPPTITAPTVPVPTIAATPSTLAPVPEAPTSPAAAPTTPTTAPCSGFDVGLLVLGDC